MKHITFIRPNFADFRSRDAMPPLAFAILAAKTPDDVKTVLLDERVEPVTFEDTDLAAISVETFTARRAYEIADEYRRRGVPVIMGGHHPTLLPREAARHCDAVVIGDADEVWERIVTDASNKDLKPVYQAPPGASSRPGGLTLKTDNSIFRGKKYAPLSLIQAGRGCRFVCDFCSVHAFYGHRIQLRPVEDIVNELRRLPRNRLIFFVDDNLFSSRAWLTALLRALAPLRLRWCCQISLDVARDGELLDLMRDAGCILALMGFESLDRRNLIQMKKKWNEPGDYENVVRGFHDWGIMIYGTFIFGYDADTPDSFGAAAEFALNANLCIANFNPLTPTPGTALYERLKAQGRLIYDRWWLHPSYRYGKAIFRPRGMHPEELEEGCMRARERFYSHASILRRAFRQPRIWRRPASLKTMLLGNYISRHEIRNKHDTALGETA